MLEVILDLFLKLHLFIHTFQVALQCSGKHCCLKPKFTWKLGPLFFSLGALTYFQCINLAPDSQW